MKIEIALKLLDLDKSTDEAAAKRAYKKMSNLHHPDKFAGQDDVIIAAQTARVSEIKLAYDTVKMWLKGDYIDDKALNKMASITAILHGLFEQIGNSPQDWMNPHVKPKTPIESCVIMMDAKIKDSKSKRRQMLKEARKLRRFMTKVGYKGPVESDKMNKKIHSMLRMPVISGLLGIRKTITEALEIREALNDVTWSEEFDDHERNRPFMRIGRHTTTSFDYL